MVGAVVVLALDHSVCPEVRKSFWAGAQLPAVSNKTIVSWLEVDAAVVGCEL